MKLNKRWLLTGAVLLGWLLQGCGIVRIPENLIQPSQSDVPSVTVTVATEADSNTEIVAPFSCDTCVNVDGKRYILAENGLYAVDLSSSEEQVIYKGSFSADSRVCTNGQIAYVLNAEREVLCIDLQSGQATVLFQTVSEQWLWGATDEGLYLAAGNLEDSWMEGMDVAEYSLTGEWRKDVASGYNGYMQEGILLLTRPQTDVRPTRYIAFAQNGSCMAKGRAWGVLVQDGALYYLSVPDDYEERTYFTELFKVDLQGTELLRTFSEHPLDYDDSASMYNGVIHLVICSNGYLGIEEYAYSIDTGEPVS